MKKNKKNYHQYKKPFLIVLYLIIHVLFCFGQKEQHSYAKNLNLFLGQPFVKVEQTLRAAGAKIQANNENMFVVSQLPNSINGVAPTQLLLSVNAEKEIMIIGYFFANVSEQKEAICKLAPFLVPYKNGYGAAYNHTHIINASRQGSSFLVSVIDCARFAKENPTEEQKLIKNIDTYFGDAKVQRPTENSQAIISPGQKLATVLKILADLKAEFKKESNKSIRVLTVHKTILSAIVSQIYIVFDADDQVMQVYYQFKSVKEGVTFAKKLVAIQQNAAQFKLLQSSKHFAAVRKADLFVLASPQEEEYKVVLISISATRRTSERTYMDIINTLESARHMEE